MKTQMLLLLLLSQVTIITKTFSQNIAINAAGNLPDTSAMLDVSSNVKGFLAPRMSTTQQNAIPLPAKGLLIFNTTDNAFRVNTGTTAVPVWTILASGSSGSVTSVGLTSSDITVGGSSPVTSSGAYTLTLPTINSNVGAFTNANVTVNAKGLVTAVSNGSVSTGWSLTGNTVTAGNQFLGSANNVSLRLRTNNTERMLVDSIGNVGIGVTNPGTQLVVKDNIEIRRVGSVAQLIFSNTAGTGDFRLGGDGGDIYWQGGGGRCLQMGSFWTTILGGDRLTTVFPDFVSSITGTSVIVAAQRDVSVALGIQGTSSQSANLTEWRNSGNNVLSSVDKDGKLGLGINAPTALLHLKAGTSTSSTAPIKFTAGTNLSTVENGTVEYDGNNYYASSGSTRFTIAKVLTGLANLDFSSTNSSNSRDLTITVTGALDGDPVSLGIPNAAIASNCTYTAFVSSANTVTVRFNNYSSGNINPSSGTFKVSVIKY